MTFDEWFVRNNDGDDSGKDIAEYAWKAGAASRDAEIAELVDALEQLIDDMGDTGHCVCEAAKQYAKDALAKVRKP